jgi:hypothetical protein
MTKTTLTSKRWDVSTRAVSNVLMLLSVTALLGLIAPKAHAGPQGQSQNQLNQNQPAQNQEDPGQIDPNQGDQNQPDPNQAGPNQGDPPTRVARISFTGGSVSLQPGGSGDWAAAAKNRPVTVGDKLWSDKDSRLELQAGQANIHVGSMTALSFLNLDQSIIQMRVPEGAINFRVRELREGDLYEVDTPNASFTVKQAGAFRVDVSENGDGTRVTVIRGEGEVVAGGSTYTVHAGERAEFNGTDNVQYTAHGAPPPDGLDRWANDRDLGEDDSVSAKYVSRDTVGYSDLDNNGTWNEEPDYGAVWYPNDVGPGWAPYSYGAWNYVGPWGWTWVGYEPWGFAPYHYGRWNYFGSRWGWCPGVYGGYPVYGPAFVGFLGGGFGFGLGFGGGFGLGVGWFPLGFGEPFHPWYHAGGRYINNINIHNTTFRNTTVINNSRNFNYAYAHNTNAVTTASRNTFVSGQAVNRGAGQVTAASLNGARVSNSAGFSPTRQSYAGAANVNARVATPPSSVQNRSVMARTSPGAGASNSAVRTRNSGSTGSSGFGNSRSQQLSQNRPSSAMANGANNNTSQRGVAGGNSGRNWAAQGSSSDGGRAPSGFGSSGNSNQTASARSDRPAWAGSGQPVGNTASNANRGYGSSQNYPSAASNRGYSSQPRSYSAPSRTYSTPSRSYPAPSRSSSAPSHSSGGSAPHSSGGGSHSGGGGSHGGGHH